MRAMFAAVGGVVNHTDHRLGGEGSTTGRPATGRLSLMTQVGLPPEDRETKRQLPKLLGARARLSKRNLRRQGGVDEQSVTAGRSGALRAAVFGINDGLLTNAALIMGFAGASQGRSVIVLAGVSGLLAGAFSMGSGEYVSMRVQRDMLERLLHLEAHELEADPVGESEELAEIYRRKGLPPELADQVVAEVMKDPKVALDTHAREELGLDPQGGLGNPMSAALSSFVMFALGALIPLFPFFFAGGAGAKAVAISLTAIALLTVGALTALLTGKSVWRSAVRILAIGVAATAVTFAIGSLLHVSTS
jgi:VIT1/CCC1 family predicted Fe2+/Mn2+ transporter